MASKDTKKPNIIFILSDDQGAWTLGSSGNKDIHTPNLDRLAKEGMRFENFFCTSPVCSPARASLITGRIPSQNGVHDWIKEGNVGKDAVEYLKGQLAYTDVLAEAGYICGLSGKWHLGDSIKPQKSFSHWYVHQQGGGPYYDAPMIKDGKLINESGYLTDAITDDALNFLDSQTENNNPFYLSVHYTAPHSPWNHHPAKFVNMYENCEFTSCPIEPTNPWSNDWGRNVQKNRNENIKGYYAAISAMDDNIGRIIDKLDELSLRQNTLICFMSDNGFNCGHHGIWGKGNGTFPLNMYDSSVKVPAIFSHKGHIPSNVVCDDLVSGYDFMPTLLDYVKLNNPEADKLPGKSFLKALLGEKCDEREDVVIYDEYGPVRMIRTKEWKYIYRYPYGPHEFYDLINDPGEKENLIDSKDKKQIIEELKYKLDEWFAEYVDPRLDGTHEAVTGHGQLGLAGPGGKGKPAFEK